MAATTNISKTISNWSQFHEKYKYENLHTICLYGTHYSGKSTLCLLFQRFIQNILKQQLIFQDTKLKLYTYLNIISNNSLKIQTNQPQIYSITSKIQNYQNCQIIDIPASTISPYNQAVKKLYSTIDSKISIGYLFNTIKSCINILMVQQKWLRAPMDTAKNLFINFLNNFTEHNQLLYNSTCIIISKCPAAYKLDQCLTRIDTCLKKVQDQKYVYQWFENIRKRNAILIFNKFSTQEHQRKQQIKNIYKSITQLKYYQITEKDKQVFNNLTQQQKTDVKKYLYGLQKGIIQLIKISLQIAQNFIKDKQSFDLLKIKLVHNINGTQQQKQKQKTNKIQLINLPQVLSIALLCVKISKLINSKQQNKNKNIFKDILNIFKKQNIIIQTQDIYKILQERAQFYQTFVNQQHGLAGWQISSVFQNIQKEVSKIREFHNLKLLTQSYQDIKQKLEQQDLKNIIHLVQYLNKPDNNDLSTIWIDASLQLAAKLPAATALKKFLQIQGKLTEMKKTDLLGNLFSKIAKILIDLGYIANAVGFYNKCGNPYQAIETMQNLKKSQDFKKKFAIKDFLPYLKLLQQIGLYEKSYEYCFYLGNQFTQDNDRPKLREFLKNAPKAPEQKSIDTFINLTARGLDQNQAKILKQIAETEEKKSFSK